MNMCECGHPEDDHNWYNGHTYEACDHKSCRCRLYRKALEPADLNPTPTTTFLPEE